MAQSQNTHNRDIFEGQVALATDQSAATSASQGDIVTFDQSLNGGNGGVRSVLPSAGQGEMVNYVGIALQNSVVNSLNDPQSYIDVAFKNIYNLKTTPGEVYKQFQVVYWNETADAQTITNSTNTGARTVVVGSIMLPQESIMNGVLTITGAAGVTIPVAIRPALSIPA